jgi:threonine dehydrogenase-like Zn-dependent dehydrogenase
MIAVQFRKSISRYLALRAVGPRWPGAYTSAVSMISLRTLPEPRLPAPEWVRVRPILSGVCGSDLATICAKGSAYLSPLTSTPFVLGHEVVGRVTEVGSAADGLAVGDRVVLQPALGCRVRGIAPACGACASGRIALCRNVTRGNISAGIQTGYCRDTGGAWSESFVAHASQLYKVPDALSDEAAVLVEPFACALHGVLRARILRAQDGDPPWRDSRLRTVLVMGCGSIGLLTITALRSLGSTARVVAVAKYPRQREHAGALGADEVLAYESRVDDRYAQLAAVLGAELHRPEIGKPTVIGGADVVFDCVASSTSIDDCLRFTRAGGAMVLVGMPAIPSGVDWTAIWFKELSVHAAYAYGQEEIDGRARSTFDLALEILQQHGARLRPLVGEPFALNDYRRAVEAALHVGASRMVKTVLRI